MEPFLFNLPTYSFHNFAPEVSDIIVVFQHSWALRQNLWTKTFEKTEHLFRTNLCTANQFLGHDNVTVWLHFWTITAVGNSTINSSGCLYRGIAFTWKQENGRGGGEFGVLTRNLFSRKSWNCLDKLEIKDAKRCILTVFKMTLWEGKGA